MDSRPAVARELFAPIAIGYQRWARILSMGQDGRWRRAMVKSLGLEPGSTVLDLAAGTGQISRGLAGQGHTVISCDQSPEMMARGGFPGPTVQATAERLPFATGSLDGVTFGYLLRYVDDVTACMTEITRVLRPGGAVGMVEFGRPSGIPGPLWWLYTRAVLPGAGTLIGHGWGKVGRFLGPSIDDFARRFPPSRLVEVWRVAGLGEVRHRTMSQGGGLLMWGRKA